MSNQIKASKAQDEKSGLHNRRKLLQNAAAAGAGAILATSIFKNLGSTAHAAEMEFDVVVIGSGAAGMTAALAAAKRGLRAVVIEKAPTFGGSAARSGGAVWIRNNEVLQEAGVRDTPEAAAAYLKAVVGPGVAEDRLDAYLEQGPSVISFLLKNTPLRFHWMEGYSDYYPEVPGGMPMGSSIEPDMLDGHLLGDELKNLNGPYIATPPGVVIYSSDYKWLGLARVSAKGVGVAAKCAARYAGALLRGEKPLSMGQALAAGLRVGLQRAKVPVWLSTPFQELTFDESGRIAGVIVRRRGIETLVKAKKGVILGSGGFERNLSMRKEFQEQPIGIDWTVGAKENTGDGIQAGKRVGAGLDLMDDAWWGPSIPLPGETFFCLAERSLPGSILIDKQGKRFVNEAAPYTDIVHRMYENSDASKDMGVWLITDQNYRNRYLFRDVLPLLPLPKAWYESGAVVKDWSIEGLAEKIGVPAAELDATIERFNDFAENGKDEDFQRGESAYDRYFSDPAVGPNPSLGKLRLPPFYAFKVVPGDLGTKGGLKTDSRARVLRPDGSAIPGLYAAGNASSSVMGHSYPGSGATLGPAMTFGFIAANDIADSSV